MSCDKTRRLYKEYMNSDQQQEWCINCQWWKCSGNIIGTDIPYEFGRCHYLPPKIFQQTKDVSRPYDEYATIVSSGSIAYFPDTGHDDFCSLFKRKCKKEQK